MFENECPMCQATVPPSQALCECGYSFQPDNIEAEAQNLMLAAQEEEAYVDYLQARYIQATEALRVIQKRLQIDTNNKDLKAQLKAAENDVFSAQQELKEMNTKLAQTRRAVKTAEGALHQVRARKERRAQRQKARQEAEAAHKRQLAEQKAFKEKARVEAETRKTQQQAQKQAQRRAREKAEQEAHLAAERRAAEETAKLEAELEAAAKAARKQTARDAAARRIEQEAERRQNEERAAREAAARRIEQEAAAREIAAANAREAAKQKARHTAKQVRHATQKAEKIRAAAQAAELAARSHLDDQQPVISKSAPESFSMAQSSRAEAALAQARKITGGGRRTHLPDPAASGLGITPANFMQDNHPELFADDSSAELISHTSAINPHADNVCPHCTATLKPGTSRCGCGYEKHTEDDDGLALSLTDTDQAALADIRITKFG